MFCQRVSSHGWTRFRLTNGYHALAVIIEVFKHHLTERIHLGTTTIALFSSQYQSLNALLFTQEISLLFQVSKQSRKLPDHARVRAKTGILVKHNTEVEDEIIALIFLVVVDADRVAYDAVLVGADGDKAIAELAAGDDVVGDAAKVEQRLLCGGRGQAGDHRAFGDLVEYCRSCAWLD